jgi:hypothetical protein
VWDSGLVDGEEEARVPRLGASPISQTSTTTIPIRSTMPRGTDTRNTKPVSIRLTPEEIAATRVLAAMEGLSMAEWCRRHVRHALAGSKSVPAEEES